MKSYRSIVILTGAGVSAESGISTFRDANGLWENYALEELATEEAFYRNPAVVNRFYNQRRGQLVSAAVVPNAAHHALAELDRHFSGDLLLVTQNVDDLHEQAGQRRVVHMHGSLLKVRCVHTGQVFQCANDIDENSVCPCCQEKGTLRPDIVWFGELPMALDAIYTALEKCDLFVAIGTSGVVYPAAGFVQVAVAAGADTLELNLQPSETQSLFAEHRYGQASELVPAWVEEVLGR